MAKGVSVKDVARAAGVSVGTVSNVLNRPDSVAEGTRERVRSAIDELGFVRNESARQLRAGHSRAIGLIVIDAANPFFGELSRGVEEYVAERGEVVLIGNTGEDPARERRYLQLFEQQRVRGVLMAPVGVQPPDVSGLRRLGIPVVFVDRLVGEEGASTVTVDDIAGGRMAGEHLVELGHRDVWFVGGPLTIGQPRHRLQGLRAAAEPAGVRVTHVDTAGLSIVEGRAIGERLAALHPSERPTAVFGANDLLAIGILNAVRSHGIDVPGELSIIGFDDIVFARTATVPLTTIYQPALEMGRHGAELLYAELGGGEVSSVRLTPHLVTRESTGPAVR